MFGDDSAARTAAGGRAGVHREGEFVLGGSREKWMHVSTCRGRFKPTVVTRYENSKLPFDTCDYFARKQFTSDRTLDQYKTTN